MRQSGGTLVEVGTTNRTYVRDFEEAITENTGAILSAHASNFKVIGFTHAPTTEELAELGRRRGVPVLHDLGSGCLLDTTRFGLAREPMPQESVSAGVSLSFFSGDKLLGGPQAGIIVGDRGLVGMASRHPLARAMRIDKLSLASLSATLVHYVKGEAVEEIPTWRMIAEPVEALRERAAGWAASLGEERRSWGGSRPSEAAASRARHCPPRYCDWIAATPRASRRGCGAALPRSSHASRTTRWCWTRARCSTSRTTHCSRLFATAWPGSRAMNRSAGR